MSEESKDQQLDDAFRRASAADAGRPDAKLRAAILAEAAAAARRHRPAANDSRYVLRAVAGVAVMGIALLIWQQARHEAPREVAMRIEQFEQPTSEPVPAQVAEDTSATADEPEAGVADAAEPRAAAPAATSAEEDAAKAQGGVMAPQQESSRSSSAPPVSPVAPPAPPPAAPHPAPPPAPESPPMRAQADATARSRVEDSDQSELSEVQVTGTRVQGPRSAPGPVVSAAEAADLLRRHFPRQYQSGQEHRLWLILDAAGRNFDSGELTGAQQLQDIQAVAGALAGAPNPWQIHLLTNARGQTIQLAVAHTRQ